MENNLFQILGIRNSSDSKKIAEEIGVENEYLRYLNENRLLPTGTVLEKICKKANIDETVLKLMLGIIDQTVIELLIKNAKSISSMVTSGKLNKEIKNVMEPVMSTPLGKLYCGDCIDLLSTMPDETVDLVFADPPFNLNKLYPSKIDDNLKSEKYLQWCEQWLHECCRVLKYGGSLFTWNLPKWNTYISTFLNHRLTFRHWISVDIKYSLPIQSRLYPSHYSLLYYCKGEKPSKFHPDRLPMEVCPKCADDLVDYGGYKDKMNPMGVNLSDVWYDIPPVRHSKYKARKDANELSIKLLDRIIELSTDEGDLVFDPFGGSGTTYIVSEIKKRKWIGIEIGPVDDIVKRFEAINEEREYLNSFRENLNTLFTADTLKKRISKKLWTCESVRERKNKRDSDIQIGLFS